MAAGVDGVVPINTAPAVREFAVRVDALDDQIIDGSQTVTLTARTDFPTAYGPLVRDGDFGSLWSSDAIGGVGFAPHGKLLGARTYYSVAVPGFPTFFMLVGPNSPIGNISLIDVSAVQSRYILKCIRRLRKGTATAESPQHASRP